jgi:hypothetical protein
MPETKPHKNKAEEPLEDEIIEIVDVEIIDRRFDWRSSVDEKFDPAAAIRSLKVPDVY